MQLATGSEAALSLLNWTSRLVPCPTVTSAISNSLASSGCEPPASVLEYSRPISSCILTTINLGVISDFMPPSPTTLDHTLHAIADPTRRRILQCLKQRGPGSPTVATGKSCLCAGDIEERVHLSQPTIS